MNEFHTTEATQVTNITLNVEDLNKMTNFYKNILGFSIKEQDDNHVIFNVGANGHTLTLQYLEDGRRPGFREAGLFHIAYLLPTRTDLANFLFHASRLNVPVGGGDAPCK